MSLCKRQLREVKYAGTTEAGKLARSSSLVARPQLDHRRRFAAFVARRRGAARGPAPIRDFEQEAQRPIEGKL